MSAAGLRAVDGIEGLIEEEADGPAAVDPGRDVSVHTRRVPEHCKEVCNDEGEA